MSIIGVTCFKRLLSKSGLLRRDNLLTTVMAFLSIVIVGGFIAFNRDKLTTDEIYFSVSPFIVLFFFWLIIRLMKIDTGVWIPWTQT